MLLASVQSKDPRTCWRHTLVTDHFLASNVQKIKDVIDIFCLVILSCPSFFGDWPLPGQQCPKTKDVIDIFLFGHTELSIFQYFCLECSQYFWSTFYSWSWKRLTWPLSIFHPISIKTHLNLWIDSFPLACTLHKRELWYGPYMGHWFLQI